MQATRVERHVLERCPDCQYRLRGESLDYSRRVVELPPPQPVEVIEHQVVKRWCPRASVGAARSWISAGRCLGKAGWGCGWPAPVAYLRTTLRLPVSAVRTYLDTLHQLRLSVGEIVELTHDVRQRLQGQADKFLEQVRQQ